jgi:hypothetical protein
MAGSADSSDSIRNPASRASTMKTVSLRAAARQPSPAPSAARKRTSSFGMV